MLKEGKQIYETRPLEIWAKAKELRAKWQQSISESAVSERSFLAHGNTGDAEWPIGFEGLNVVEDNPAGAMMASVSDAFSRKARLASEVRGWGRELCGYVNNCWGAQFLGRDTDGKPFAYRNMCIPFPDPCDQHTKRGQQCMDLSPIPRWGADNGMYLGEWDPPRDKELLEHRIQCILRIINDIERVFGIRFDDEKFLENLDVRAKLEDYGLEIARLMTRRPAPISQKDLYSFYTLGTLTKGDPQELLDFWKAFVDEVKWRADNRIAAVGNERYRWMEHHPSPWHFLKYFRYMEQYGAVCVGSQYSHLMAGRMELKDDGSLGRRFKPPAPAGKPKTREDGLRRIFTESRSWVYKDEEYFRKSALTDFAKAFHVDGAVMPLWRCGVGCTINRKEQGLRLSAMGVRVLHYEGSQPGDRTDMDENRFLDALDAWMESQGLEKLAE
jgi:benzoyl-CoA reductase subunit B